MIWNPIKECMPEEQKRELQGKRLHKVVDYVYHNVPFYRHKMQEMGIEPRQTNDGTSSNEGKGAKQMTNPETGSFSEPHLMPNPTTGEVNVIGTADEVVEILVMDMNGRKMATFENTANFNISTLPSGIYIVRVKTHLDNETHNASPRTPQELVSYLKLVKK